MKTVNFTNNRKLSEKEMHYQNKLPELFEYYSWDKVDLKDFQNACLNDPKQARKIHVTTLYKKDSLYGRVLSYLSWPLPMRYFKVVCDSCCSVHPVLSRDFSGWTKEGYKDFCGRCSESNLD